MPEVDAARSMAAALALVELRLALSPVEIESRVIGSVLDQRDRLPAGTPRETDDGAGPVP